MSMTHYLTIEEAAAIAAAPQGMIDGIIKLVSHGLKAQGVHEYATALAAGNEPPALPVLGGPKPIKIQLHSFLHDPRQYSDTYGMAPEEVERLRSVERADPEAAREAVLTHIAAHPRIIQSGRPVSVVFDGAPGDTPGAAQPLANASGVTKSLSAEIASGAPLYGAYKFNAFETPLGETQRFAVDLGGNFFAVTFSKRNAISAARIASVKGRKDPAVLPYIVYVNSGGNMVSGGDIAREYWDCRRGPRDPLKATDRQLGRAGPATGNRRTSTGPSVAG